jgi:hypothetical protein
LAVERFAGWMVSVSLVKKIRIFAVNFLWIGIVSKDYNFAKPLG